MSSFNQAFPTNLSPIPVGGNITQKMADALVRGFGSCANENPSEYASHLMREFLTDPEALAARFAAASAAAAAAVAGARASKVAALGGASTTKTLSPDSLAAAFDADGARFHHLVSSLGQVGVGYGTFTAADSTAGLQHYTVACSAGANRWDAWKTLSLMSPGAWGGDKTTVNWSQRFGVEVDFALTVASTPTNGDGMAVAYPASRISNAKTLTGAGIGVRVEWVGGANLGVVLMQHNGSTQTDTALLANLGRATGGTKHKHRLRLMHEAGVTEIFVDDVYVGKASAGPTAVADTAIANRDWYFMPKSEGGAVTLDMLPPRLISPTRFRRNAPKAICFLWMGQSNAVGGNYSTACPQNYEGLNTDGLFLDCGKAGTWGTDASCPVSGTGAIPAPALDRVAASAGSNYGYGHIAFARRMQRLFPGQRIVVIKHACNGSPLQGYWRKVDNLYYQSAVATVAAHLATLRTAGYDASLAGAYWWQGEGDCWTSVDASLSAAYGANLTRLVADFRSDLDAGAAPNLPFAVVRLPSWQQASSYMVAARHQTIRDAETEFVAADAGRSVLIDTDDTTATDADKVHANLASYELVGVRAAIALASVLA